MDPGICHDRISPCISGSGTYSDGKMEWAQLYSESAFLSVFQPVEQ